MSTFQLLAEPRTVKGKKVRQLRAQGYVPAILYGTAIKPTSIQIARRELESVLRDAGVTNLISVQIGDSEEAHTAVVRSVQYDVISREVEHVDFMQIMMDEKISIEVNIVLEGDSLVGGSIYQDLNSVEVECLPGDMISTITVDVSGLTLDGDPITVKDLRVPRSVTILADGDQLVAHAEAFRLLEEESEEPKIEMGTVEVASSHGQWED